MTTITRRKTRRHLTKLGDRIGVSLDPLTRSRIVHGVHVARLLGIECNQASVKSFGQVRSGLSKLHEAAMRAPFTVVPIKLSGAQDDGDDE